MTVQIEIVGSPDKDEFQDSKSLRKVFEQGLSGDTEGRISIVCGVQLFGQNPRDVDIVVLGNLKGAIFKVKTNTFQDKLSYQFYDVSLDTFCFCIETKAHNVNNIEMRGTNLIVKYGGNKLHDATSQSEGQRYSLHNYLSNILPNISCWICNFLWMRNLEPRFLKQLVGDHPHNILASSFNLSDLVTFACLQSPPRKLPTGNNCSFSSIRCKHEYVVDKGFSQLHDLLCAPKQAVGALTRKNVERITGREIILDQSLREALGNKLVIIAGRAGTGKTVKMLRIGCELASDLGKRCLFLTYNRALVNDIQRLLYFAEVPTDYDQACLSVMTIHEFTRKIGIALGVVLSEDYELDNHIGICEEIVEYIETGVVTQEDLLALMKNRHELACWDHVFVDEAQDFHEIEKLFLFKFFGYQKLVISDGVDQFVRGIGHLDWGKNVYQVKVKEKRSLRQERNLVGFVNSFAKESNLNWHVESVPELLGGNVIISSELTPFDIFQEVRDQCYSKGNKAFEILFLTPPNLVENGAGKKRCFKLMQQFQDQGFYLWDGTQKDLRSSAPLKIDQHRLLQYDSCRGLEGWCIVCLGFDDFINYKRETFLRENKAKNQSPDLIAMDSEEMCKHFVGLWSLIPLTRAIDTIVITLSSPNGPVAESLRRCANEDYVKFHTKKNPPNL